MTGNTSATGGYLVSPDNPANDDSLTDFMQSVVVGITQIPGRYVRPRWQEEPPNLPPVGTNWAAIGVTHEGGDAFPYVEHHDTDPNDVGDTVVQNENFSLFCSFYGPNCDARASSLRDGIMIAQNREAMLAVGIKLIVCGSLSAVPDLIKEKWLNRTDITLQFRREVRRNYPVLSILSASGVIHSTAIDETFEANPGA